MTAIHDRLPVEHFARCSCGWISAGFSRERTAQAVSEAVVQ